MIGAVVGLGGGVIIRPILDAIDYHNVMNIAFLSSAAVLIMAVVSTVKKVRDGTKIDALTAALISIGAFIGGILGNLLLEFFVYMFYPETRVQMVQTIFTIIILTVAVYLTYKNNVRYEITNKVFFPFLGVFLGAAAVFLGIGGGPLNVPVFMILFNLPVKQATAYSIVVIFFSHLFRIITMSFTRGLDYFDLQYLLVIVPAAIMGGVIGAIVSRKIADDTVRKAFMVTLTVIVFINIYNMVTFMA